ncbi:hypothetical protein [Sinomonas flava]
MKNPFAHKSEDAAAAPPTERRTHKGWLGRENNGIANGPSGLFFTPGHEHTAPARTCIHGHDILPGQDTCSQGHLAG